MSRTPKKRSAKPAQQNETLPKWMTPVPNPVPLDSRAQTAIAMAMVEGPMWTDFEATDGRAITLRGRPRQALLMLTAAATAGTGVLKSELPGNGAAAVQALSEAGVSIARVEKQTDDGATVTGHGQATSYVLMGEGWQQTSGLYESDTQAQAAMELGDGKKASGKAVSAKGAGWPYVRSGLIRDHLDLQPLNGNKSAAAKSIRTGKELRNARAGAKAERKRLNRQMDFRQGSQKRSMLSIRGTGKGKAA